MDSRRWEHELGVECDHNDHGHNHRRNGEVVEGSCRGTHHGEGYIRDGHHDHSHPDLGNDHGELETENELCYHGEYLVGSVTC